jgi:hypothetical protein
MFQKKNRVRSPASVLHRGVLAITVIVVDRQRKIEHCGEEIAPIVAEVYQREVSVTSKRLRLVGYNNSLSQGEKKIL